MAVLLIQHPVRFPVAAVRRALTRYYPSLAWRAGDEDHGGNDDVASFLRPHTILGRGANDMVMLCVTLHEAPYRPANGHQPPAHAMHLTISRPSLDDENDARGIALIAATAIAVEEDERAWLQLAPGETWLDPTDMRSLAKMLEGDPALRQRGQVGRPEALDGGEAPVPAPAPAPEAEQPPVEAKAPASRLGSFTLLHDGNLFIDWDKIEQAMNAIDPGGNWSGVVIPQGMGFCQGRAKIMLIASPIPCEPQAIANCYQRSHWFAEADKARVARHRGYVTVLVDAPDDYQARAQTAKAATILVGIIALLPQVAAVMNDMVSTIFSPERTKQLVSILHHDEVPIQLWTWVAPNSLSDGDVSLTTGGLEPFLGYEVEVWNAPHPLALVDARVVELLRYLLINGPVIAHGDTIGTSEEDQSIRCFFGPSRADRTTPVKAMFVEFDIDRPDRPRKDMPLPPTLRPDAPAGASPPTPARPGGAPLPARRPATFGRKGL
ncbi:DUF4261 domain-containing protein [Sphingomonas sp.]|uniref:DUF4261 domain-containing protein n=1 Tax=Sphingomonas sp. TaxID=28214 RepID=UPI001B2DEEEA|nr:DUF4261 domain-containing protein [Sphingomonas sp.]MBO9713336.1 DUF4261 domain-containing protein [Sphingomonas sp.]